ncbi:hypothetical protein DUNSADRAFT_12612 [Dunaliella salina]|uniref:Endonuclease/exonuclease/phosphatase domain-containing protein n=1 Tax=Dunaliella salina TaxID=3046 RepID=A0ABQ7GB04_DUNSA|nr:hypothetical protein DUNSADRAFT_12612 [Dunaliella salina]|eukprot:KAF5831774.1 hypothetical protein DUNSADRAFT_12612 [Dunaliella salina]
MSTTIDLTGEEDGRHSMQQSDEAQRQAIMAFARSKLDSGPPGPVHEPGDKISEHAGSNKRARSQEQGQNSEATASVNCEQQPTQAVPKQCPAQPKNSMNDMLNILRLEREERQRQRQRREAQETPGMQSATDAEQLQQQQPERRGSQDNGSVQHKRKREYQNPCASTSSGTPPSTTATILSYNVWFDPDGMEERMEGLGKEVERAGWPDIILLQEVTLSALNCFSQASWCKRYTLMPLPDPPTAYFTLTLARTDTVRVGTRERVPFPNSCQVQVGSYGFEEFALLVVP